MFSLHSCFALRVIFDRAVEKKKDKANRLLIWVPSSKFQSTSNHTGFSVCVQVLPPWSWVRTPPWPLTRSSPSFWQTPPRVESATRGFSLPTSCSTPTCRPALIRAKMWVQLACLPSFATERSTPVNDFPDEPCLSFVWHKTSSLFHGWRHSILKNYTLIVSLLLM